MPISIFACESQPIVVEGLTRVFDSQPDLEFVGTRQTIGDAGESVRSLQPDVVLIDHLLGLKSALQFVSDCKTMSPNSKAVLWVNELAEAECFRVLQMGVRGILKKTMTTTALLDCIRSVGSGTVWVENSVSAGVSAMLGRRGSPRLTPREREIVHHVCRGLKNKEIATSLSITPGTVKVHLMHIFEKTGVKDRFELAVHGRKLTGEVAE